MFKGTTRSCFVHYLAVACCLLVAAVGALRLPEGLFGDNMVLQRPTAQQPNGMNRIGEEAVNVYWLHIYRYEVEMAPL